MSSKEVIDVLLEEDRTFSPPEEFAKDANANDPKIYEEGEDLEAFWAERAEENIDWFEKWDEVLDWSNPPYAEWFINGKLNASYNCLDRHLKNGRKNKAALTWEGELGETVTYTYQTLYNEVCKFANVLKGLGVEKGDRVAVYLPMIPEAAVVMLACARIGAPHTVVFAGFSPSALAERMNDAEASVVVTCDGYYRRGNVIDHKTKTDKGLEEVEKLDDVIVVQRAENDVNMEEGRDHWWHELMADADRDCEPEVMDAEDMLFLMYTSGTTGKPKGVVHTTGGYLTYATTTSKYIFDLKEDDTYWCTADVGWITGHSYIVYGILANGASMVMYEGAPNYPTKNRFWEIIEKYQVNILYTAPTAIRLFMKWGAEYPESHDLSSLRLLGSVGEPINPRAWMWYHEHIGGGECPIVDTWWQTETGGIIVSPLPGITELKPGSATNAFPSLEVDVLDEDGNPADSGYLAIKRPWPGMLRTLYNNPERFENTYWSKWDNTTYFAGDGAKKDEDGYIWVLGRVDDVMNVSGHRLSTVDIESALVDHESVAESAAVGVKHDVKGHVPFAYVILDDKAEPSEELKQELRNHVSDIVSPIAKPADLVFAPDLPKTRSGKIMRRLLKAIANGEDMGNTSTLANPEIAEELQAKVAKEEVAATK
ncbi:acetate--CoA ligase [Natroniella sulfidigena]|uniref:acetate--CoA ligase n=1 Tax=Natroniella sulfidigena TaxID=723921 RepID=UPI00200B82E2|nr:acetate--CoA ligase [Natroniella sulfidigena]MCK8816264.1 acetate--CoA ligase [Natroniella sulfidigena]